jgi:hypothetical protein
MQLLSSTKFSKYIVLANVSLHRSIFRFILHTSSSPMRGRWTFRPFDGRSSMSNVEELESVRPSGLQRSSAGNRLCDFRRNSPRFICRSGSWRSSTVSLAAKTRRARDRDRDCANDGVRRRGITASMRRNSRRTISVSGHWTSIPPSPVAACSP